MTRQGSTGSRFLLQAAILGCVLAVIVRMAPGEPSWIELSDVQRLEHPLPSIGSKNPYILQTFRGGDGVSNLVGRLYLPPPEKVGTRPPLVVMAHGLGLVQDAKLTPFLDTYIEAGIAVMTFDYATCGWSEGWPRHQVIPHRRLADWHAALAHVRNNLEENVDIHRLALWGISLAGGHVLNVAASDSDIKAVVACVPHINSGLEGVIGSIVADPTRGILGFVKVSGALVKWFLNDLVERLVAGHAGAAMYIPLHGVPGSAAVMQNPGDDEGYGRLVKDLPASLQWKNRVSASSLLPLLLYRPLNAVTQISSPTLLVSAELDTLCPAAAVAAAAARMDPHTTKLVVLKETLHFQVYDGEPLQRILQESRSFLINELFAKGEAA
jgi:alpha-beta hydrolase superfamily lysophospholipase